MAGGQIDIRVEPDVKDFPGKLEGGLSGALGTAAKIGSALGLALGAGTAAKAVMEVGLSFDKQMNTMSAVSQGTAAQMDAVAARARELGNDTDLTATSASDAAAAMVELAKGGFTVEQSMEAAKGTLQLAAAAQIDAASAATIQSQALQSFSLGAEDAARVSDILAGAANASSAEIEGIAQGLQQSGTVANQFGLTIDDTATALAMFANAGIQGSDAGTLLKSALLALTDQGAPAQGAIEDLGLSIYDLQGNFVGLPTLFDQLKDAQANMTPEAYQAATATLFGSDAMRLAGIAAEQGSEGFNSLKEDVTRAGQAAEVAAAQTQGLPGALERAQNAAEELGLKVYDAVKGPLTEAANSGVDAMENLGPAIESAASMGASAFSTLMSVATPAIGVFTDLAGVVMGLPAPLLAMGAAIPLAKMSGLTGALSTGGGALKLFGAEMLNSGRAAKSFKTYFDETGRSISTFDGLMMAAGSSTNKTLSQMGRAYTQTGTQMRANGQLAKEVAKEHTGLSRVLGTAGGSLKTFGGTAAGVAGGGMSLLKSGASGLMGALGGPWGLAIAGAGTALGILAQKHEEAAQKEAEHKAQQDALRDSLDQTTGSITEQSRQLDLDNLRKDDGAKAAALEAGVSLETVSDARLGNAQARQRVDAALDVSMARAAENNQTWQGITGVNNRFDELDISYQDIANAKVGAAGAKEKIDQAFADSDMSVTEIQEYEQYLSDIQGSMGDVEEGAANLRKEMGRTWDGLKSDQADITANQLLKLKESIEQTGKAMDVVKGKDFKLENAGENGQIKASIEYDEVSYWDTKEKLEELGAEVSKPMNGRVSITFPEGADILSILQGIGIEAERTKDGYVHIENPDAPECIASLEELNLKTTTLEDGRVVIDSNDPEVQARLEELGMGYKDMNGEFHLSDNILDVQQKNDALNGTQTNGDHNVRDNVNSETKPNIDSLNNRNTSSTHTVYITEIGAGGYNQVKSQGYSDAEAWMLMDGYRDGGQIPALAVGGTAGGRLPTSGPGTDRVDGILGVDGNGIPTARVNRGEWVITERQSERFHPVLGAINRGDAAGARMALDALPGLASGGVVDSIVGLVNENFPMMSITSTYRNTADLHGQGKAVDASNGYDDTPEMQEMAQWFYDRYQYQLAELIHSPFGNNVKNGDNVGDGMSFYGSGTMAEHRNHVHIAAQAPLDDEDEAWKDRTKDDDKDETPEEKSRSSAASSAADEAERRRQMVAESKPEIVETNVSLGPDPVATAMFNPQTDPDGLLVLTRGGDYTERFGNRYGVSEDDTLVRFLLWAKGGQDEKDDDLASAFTVDNDPKGIRSLTEAGVFTSRFGDAFGVGESSSLVTAILAAREKGGTNTLRVSAWNDEYGDVDTSVSGIAGKVAKSFVESAVGDVFAAFGVDDGLGPLTQAAIAGAKYAYGINTGTSYENMQSAAAASGQQSTKFSSAYSDMTASEADSAGATGGRNAAQYDPSRGAEQWRDTIIAALARSGRPSSEEGVTEQQVDIESGGNPAARNDWDSNAAKGDPSIGLLQVIGSTFRAYRDQSLPDDQTHPLANLVAGIKYATATYGGPSSIWPTTAGYAAGGMFSPLDSGKAAIVPPNTMRLIGDRTDVDEFYLPDTPDSVATGAEWARRRGLQLTIAGNQRRRDDRMATAISTQAQSGPHYQGGDVHINGFDRHEVDAGIRMAEKKARWKEGY